MSMTKIKIPKRPREWVPSAFLLIHTPNISCTIRYTPMQHRRNPDARYFSHVKIFGNSAIEPVWETKSGPLPLQSNFALESGAIAADLGIDKLFHYGEVLNSSPDFNPPDPNVSMASHLHYRSTDGSFYGGVSSFTIFGAPRRIERGAYHYEAFPSMRVDEEKYFSVYIINPFVRPAGFWVQIVTKDGEKIESERCVVRGKGVASWSSKGLEIPRDKNPLGVIVRSETKTTSVFTTSTRDGKMIGLDHGHPFLLQVLNHVRPVTVAAGGGGVLREA